MHPSVKWATYVIVFIELDGQECKLFPKKQSNLSY